MMRQLRNMIADLLFKVTKRPELMFGEGHYRRHNVKRLEHLASLKLPIEGATVLEVGAGIGDHTSFFLDRGCAVTTSDAREENLQRLSARYPSLRVIALDLDDPPADIPGSFDIVYCYGTLYHLKYAEKAIVFMSRCCASMLLLETCVSYGDEALLNQCPENLSNPTQSVTGVGCRPTRRWVYETLKKHFACVYMPVTQPDHEEFPTDWTVPPADKKRLARAVFIASRRPIANGLLSDRIPEKQTRCR